MKRAGIILLLLTCLMAAFCPVYAAVECTVPQKVAEQAAETLTPDVPMIGSAAANGKYASMGDLYQAWGGHEGYPDYVCGVWSTDGGMTNLTVAVVSGEAGESGKQEILSQLEDPNTVTFTSQRYSFQKLQSVMNSIEGQMSSDSPIVACCISEMENVVQVTMDAENRAANAMTAALTGAYGDKVQIVMGSAVHTLTEDSGGGGLWVFIAGAVVLLAAVILRYRLSVQRKNTDRK